jgi:hypothetical protein
VEIKVLQGERPLSRDNKQLGVFHLDGIPPAPRGVPQIEVTFDIDANGILRVSAKDLGTGKELVISIGGSSGLSKEDIERMQSEAATHAGEDKHSQEAIVVRNDADLLAYQCEKQLKELGDKISGDKKRSIENAIAAVRDAINRNDIDAMKRTYDDLQNKFQEVSGALYKQVDVNAQTAGAGASRGSEAGASARPQTKESAKHQRANTEPKEDKEESNLSEENLQYTKTTVTEQRRPLSVFISYSHTDEALRDELDDHLYVFQRQELIQPWHDRKILPGDEWGIQIETHLSGADLVLLLISAKFLRSDFCYEKEMKRALERHATGETRVVPIIVRPCAWQESPFAFIQVLPKDGISVVEHPTHDLAWANVVRELRKLIEDIQRKRLR